MTNEQREFAEKNHHLIYSCAIHYKILIEEYYDTLAIGFCKAVINYKPDKGAFSTLAYTCMYMQYLQELRSGKRARAIPENLVISLDEPINSDLDKSCFISDLLPSDTCVESEVLIKSAIDEFKSSLSEKEIRVLNLLEEGYAQKDIGKELGLSQPQVSRLLLKMRKRFSQLYN